MSDWQKGDIALCVHDGRWISPEGLGVWDGGPRRGQLFNVTDVELCETLSCGVGLVFDRYPIDVFAACFFRKVTPETADEFDEETIKLLNRAPKREMA